MFKMRDVESRCIAQVAHARGCTAKVGTANEWPDGWLVTDDDVWVAAEVVTAFPSPDGSKWAKNYQKAARDASQRQPPAGFHIDRRGNTTVLDSADVTLPPALAPIDNVSGIVAAIQKKASKYRPHQVSGSVLVVHHVQQISLLSPFELAKIAEGISSYDAAFLEVWIVNEYGDMAQRVPTV